MLILFYILSTEFPVLCVPSGKDANLEMVHDNRQSTWLSGWPLNHRQVPHTGELRTTMSVTRDELRKMVKTVEKSSNFKQAKEQTSTALTFCQGD